MIYEFSVLTSDEVRRINQQYDKTVKFKDGTTKITTNLVDKTYKNTREIDAHTPEYRYCLDTIHKAFSKTDILGSIYIMNDITPPIMTEYPEGGFYTEHVDSILIQGLRTDHSLSVFLSDPDEYEGGELVIGNGDAEQSFKCKAGNVLIYPTGLQHKVNKVTKGKRRVAIMWATSSISDPVMRNELIILGRAISNTVHYLENNEEDLLKRQELLVPLEQVRSNLLRTYGDIRQRFS